MPYNVPIDADCQTYPSSDFVLQNHRSHISSDSIRSGPDQFSLGLKDWDPLSDWTDWTDLVMEWLGST